MDHRVVSTQYLPVFLELRDALVVVTGSSPSAIGFVRRALDLGARVRLVATAPVEGLPVEIVTATPAASHLDGASLLVAGSEDDTSILAAARERGLLAVDLSGEGTAHLGEAVVTAGITLAASTAGRSPELERRLVAAATSSVKPEHERMAGILASIRPKLEERFPDESKRAAIWQQILDSPVMVLLESGLDDEALEMAERMAWGTG